MTYTRRQRFVASKCDRCGKATKGTQNGTDLYLVNDNCHDPRVQDQGSFCRPCLNSLSENGWLAWFLAHRPHLLADEVTS